MKVLSAGYVGKDNPHELLINQALAKQEIRVICIKRKNLLPLFQGWLKHTDAQIYHLHWLEPLWRSPIGFKSWIKSIRFWLDLSLIKLCRVKIIWTVHNLQNHENIQTSLEKLNQYICALLADRVIVHCKSARAQVSQKLNLSDPKIALIEHSSYLGYYKPLKPNKLRTALNLEKTRRVYLFLGTLRPYKGLDTLISSFKQLSDSDIALVIAGWADNQQKQHLKSLAASDSRIKLLSQKVNENQLSQFFGLADIVVLPYRQILNSGSLWLAFSFAKPVIAPSRGCLPDYLTNQGGIVYQKDSQLTGALHQSLAWNQEKLQQLGNHNFRLAQTYTPTFEAQKTAQLYKQVVTP